MSKQGRLKHLVLVGLRSVAEVAPVFALAVCNEPIVAEYPYAVDSERGLSQPCLKRCRDITSRQITAAEHHYGGIFRKADA